MNARPNVGDLIMRCSTSIGLLNVPLTRTGVTFRLIDHVWPTDVCLVLESRRAEGRTVNLRLVSPRGAVGWCRSDPSYWTLVSS